VKALHWLAVPPLVVLTLFLYLFATHEDHR
jgi:hypothetical protein